MEATGVAYTFPFKRLYSKKSQGVKSGERGGHFTGPPFQSNFWAPYCPNTFSREMNNVQAHRPSEKCNRLLSTLNVGRHIQLTCFCSSRPSHFDLGRSIAQ